MGQRKVIIKKQVAESIAVMAFTMLRKFSIQYIWFLSNSFDTVLLAQKT